MCVSESPIRLESGGYVTGSDPQTLADIRKYLLNLERSVVLRYSPPKSSLWGHLMGRKAPVAFRDAVIAFLDQAARCYETKECWLSCHVPATDSADGVFIREFVAHNDVPSDLATRLGLTYVDEEIFDQCLEWYLSNHQLLQRKPKQLNTMHFSMQRMHEVLGWNFGPTDDSQKIGGMLHEGYGTLQYIGTFLTFRSMEEFLWVKSVAHSTLGIRMNDKHIRPRKAVDG